MPPFGVEKMAVPIPVAHEVIDNSYQEISIKLQ